MSPDHGSFPFTLFILLNKHLQRSQQRELGRSCYGFGAPEYLDNNWAPTSGNFNLRIMNAPPAMGSSVDVYVEPTGTGPTGTPANLADGSASGYFGLSTNNTWHVIFTVTNAGETAGATMST